MTHVLRSLIQMDNTAMYKSHAPTNGKKMKAQGALMPAPYRRLTVNVWMAKIATAPAGTAATVAIARRPLGSGFIIVAGGLGPGTSSALRRWRAESAVGLADQNGFWNCVVYLGATRFHRRGQSAVAEEFDSPERAADLETLAPQESLWLKVKADLMGPDGQPHAVTQLLYDNPGVAFGIKDGWKGVVPVRGE